VARARRNTWIVFILFAVLATMFGILGPWTEQGEMDRDSKWLITSYATVAVVLTVAIALTAYRRGEKWAWLAFWVWPAFFILHGIVFFVVDFLFALIGIIALLAARPRRDIANPS
jgi:amino acid transporter